MLIHLRALLVAVVVCAAQAATSFAATPMAERVPGDALVYVGWRGAADAPEGFEQTHVKALLDETKLRSLLTRTLPQLLDQYAADDRQMANVRDAVDGLWGLMWQRPWAFYLTGVDTDMMAHGGPPMPKLGLVIATEGDDPALREQIEQLQALGLPAQLVEGDGYVGLISSADAAPVDGGGLAESEKLAEAMAPLSDEAVVVSYVDVTRVLALVQERAQAMAGPDEAQQLATLLDTLGLEGVHSIALTAGFDGPRWETRMFVHAPAPRRGMIEAMLVSEPIEAAHLSLVPRTSTWMSVSRLDLAQLYDRGRELVAEIEPTAQDDIDEMLFMASAMSGVDIEADLLRGLGPVWVAYRDASVAGPTSWLGVSIANPLRDPERVDEAMQGLSRAISDAIKPEWDDEPHFRSVAFEHDGTMVHSFTIPFIQPTWAVHEGTLHFGFAPQAVTTAIDFTNNGGETILDNANFQTVRDWLGDGEVNAIEFTDLPRTVPNTYSGALLFGQLASSMGIAMNRQDDGEAIALLPPLSRLMPHVEPAAQVVWVDDDGWHVRGISPFPGSTLLGHEGIANPSIIAMSAGIMLPALGAARQTARHVQSASNVRQLCLAIFIYAEDHENAFPDELAQVYLQGHIADVGAFVSPQASVDIPVTFATWEADRQADWIRNNSSYVLMLEELPETTLLVERPSEFIILFERPDHLSGDKMVVGFGDGHVETLSIADARNRIMQQTGQTLEELLERQQTYSDE